MCADSVQEDYPEPPETMDLDTVELVNLEARRNRQLAIQDSLQASDYSNFAALSCRSRRCMQGLCRTHPPPSIASVAYILRTYPGQCSRPRRS